MHESLGSWRLRGDTYKERDGMKKERVNVIIKQGVSLREGWQSADGWGIPLGGGAE